MPELDAAKQQLDVVIRKARVHLYKPIQIAEILRIHRLNRNFSITDLEAYRNPSKRWRDNISLKLVGRRCTSSARFQDNVFESNAMPPELLAILAAENEKAGQEGIVEAYIYGSMKAKFGALEKLSDYVINATPETFKLNDFISGFVADSGLKRSIDKAYEITVFALFDTIVRHLKIEISIKLIEERDEIIREFEDLTKILLNLDSKQKEITFPARFYRVGVANAADRGLDMWANFGPAVQVKHLSLSEDIAKEIADEITADRIIIVCKTADKTMIDRVLTQLGISNRIQGVITQSDLEKWYLKCFSENYKLTLGSSLLKNLGKEFIDEFPSSGTALLTFMQERGYHRIPLSGIFELGNNSEQLEIDA